jgi:hypothetical protein
VRLAQGFLRNYSRGMAPPATGAEDAQADCVARLAPLVAAFAGETLVRRRAVMLTNWRKHALPPNACSVWCSERLLL